MLFQIIWSCWGWVFIYIDPPRKEKSWSSRQLSKNYLGYKKSQGAVPIRLDRIVWAMYGLAATAN